METFFGLLIITLIILFIWSNLKPKKEMYCKNCGSKGIPINNTPGSFFIEVVLWLFLIIPGIIYTLWRLTSRKKVCPHCKSPNIIPTNSALARSNT